MNDLLIGAIYVTRKMTKKGAILAGIYFVPLKYRGESMFEPDLFDYPGSPSLAMLRACNPETDLGYGAEHFIAPYARCGFNTVPHEPFDEQDVEVCGKKPILTMAYPVLARTKAEVGKIERTLDMLEHLEDKEANSKLGAIEKIIRFSIENLGRRDSIMSLRQLCTDLSLLVLKAVAEARIPAVIPIGKSEFDFRNLFSAGML